MNCYLHRASLFLILIVVLTGCNGATYPAVSGKVTMNGKPVPSLTVVFTPVGSASEPAPGPYSTGVTDEKGNFILKTRNGEEGAVPGPHRVGVEYSNSDEMGDLKFQLREADEESKPGLQKRIRDLKKLNKSQIKVPANLIYKFEVPKEGTSTANFELNSR